MTNDKHNIIEYHLPLFISVYRIVYGTLEIFQHKEGAPLIVVERIQAILGGDDRNIKKARSLHGFCIVNDIAN